MQSAQNLLSFVALVGAALLPGCSPAENSTESIEATANAPQNVSTPPEAMTAEGAESGGSATILRLQDGSPTSKSDPIMAIEDAKFSTGITGDFIVANVRYGGGCKDHDFAAYWAGSWMESLPPGTIISLSHDAKGDTCKRIVTETLQINIARLTANERRFWAQLGGGGATSGRVEVVK